MSAEIEYRVQIEAIKCNTEVAMKTIRGVRNLKIKSKMDESRFASSDEIIVDQLKLNAKNKTLLNKHVAECLGKMGN